MSNVVDFPSDPISPPPLDDPEGSGGPLLENLNTPITKAFRTSNTPVNHRLTFLMPGAFCDSFSHRDWLIKDVMERGSLGQLFGASETLKSFLAIDMGLCIAADIPWHGHAVRQGGVAYICGEGRSGLGRRMRAWGIQHGRDIDNLPFFITDRAAVLCEQKSADETSHALSYMAAAYSQTVVELVIIDTLARNFGGDETTLRT